MSRMMMTWGKKRRELFDSFINWLAGYFQWHIIRLNGGNRLDSRLSERENISINSKTAEAC